MATIHIKDLHLRAIIGTHPSERANKQDLLVNVTLEYDAQKAGKTDAIKDAVDYYVLATKIRKMVERSKHRLLERLAKRLLDMIMENKRITKVTIRLDKPQAIPQAKSVSFELSAQKD